MCVYQSVTSRDKRPLPSPVRCEDHHLSCGLELERATRQAALLLRRCVVVATPLLAGRTVRVATKPGVGIGTWTATGPR